MTIKFNPAVLIAIAMGLFLLIFGSIKSCNNTKNAISENKELKKVNAALRLDSIHSAEQDEEYKKQVEFQDGQIALKENQLQAKDDSLEAANYRIAKLISNHVPVQVAIDTNVTIVPNEYIEGCEGCFVELAGGRALVSRYKKAADSLFGEYVKRKIMDSLRISYLNNRTSDLMKATRELTTMVTEARDQAVPTRKIFVSAGTLLINANIPNAIGGGIAYQDRYSRIYSIKYYASKYGGIKQADFFIPLSFKRKR